MLAYEDGKRPQCAAAHANLTAAPQNDKVLVAVDASPEDFERDVLVRAQPWWACGQPCRDRAQGCPGTPVSQGLTADCCAAVWASSAYRRKADACPSARPAPGDCCHARPGLRAAS